MEDVESRNVKKIPVSFSPVSWVIKKNPKKPDQPNLSCIT